MIKSKKILVFVILFVSALLLMPTSLLAQDYDDISKDIMEEYESLLNDSQTALEEGNFSEAKTKLDRASLLLWNNSPLKSENATLVQRAPSFYGDIIPREDKTYHHGERLYFYFEPKNYLIEKQDKYLIDMVLETKLIHEDETIVFHDPEFLKFQRESVKPNQEVVFDLFFDLGSSIESGEYTMENIIYDQLSGEQTKVETKFDFTE